MITIQELLRELCSDNVPSKPLGGCCTIAKGVQLNREGLLEAGPYPVINGGIEASGYWTESNFPANRITVSQGGASAGFVNFMHVPFWAGAHCFVLEKPVSGCSYRYLWHCLKQNQTVLMQRKEGAGIPGLGKSTLASISIPLPPLPVQEEIVRRLDAMQDVVEALENELALRRKQYEAVREKIIANSEFGEEDISQLIGQQHVNIMRGEYITKKNSKEGNIPVILGGQEPAYYIDRYNHKGRAIVISRSGASAGFVSFWNEPIFVTDGFAFDCDETKISIRYLFHSLKHLQGKLNQMKRGAGVPHVTGEDISGLKIPIPPLPVQKEIAKKLDAFDELVNVALPAEIAARRRAMEAVRERFFATLEAIG